MEIKYLLFYSYIIICKISNFWDIPVLEWTQNVPLGDDQDFYPSWHSIYSHTSNMDIFPNGNSNDYLSQIVSICNVVTLLFYPVSCIFSTEKNESSFSRRSERPGAFRHVVLLHLFQWSSKQESVLFGRKVRKRLLSISKTTAVKQGSTVLVLGWVTTWEYMVL